MKTMDYDEYSKLDGLTASTIEDYAEWNANPPPPKGDQPYFHFGNRFEEVVRMRYDSDYRPVYGVMPEGPDVPDDWQETLDMLRDNHPISSLYTYTTKGELHKGKKKRHYWLDQITEGLVDFERPMVSFEDQQTIDIMMDKLIKMPVQSVSDIRVDELLRDSWWSVPITWDLNGIKKKALIDVIGKININGKMYLVPFDLKTTATEKNFHSLLRRRYQYQERHYSEGMIEFEKGLPKKYEVFPALVFLVATKTGTCLPFSPPKELDQRELDRSTDGYNQMAFECHEWIEGGSRPLDFLPQKPYIWRG